MLARHNETVWPYLNWLLDTYSQETLDELHQLRLSTRKITDDELRKLLESHRQTLRKTKATA
jgi:hypothetical protein